MIRKFLMVSLLVIVASFCMTYVTFPRCGGDAFAGSLVGGLGGSMLGTAIANSGSRPAPTTTRIIESSDGRAMRAVDRLEDVVDREVEKLNNKFAKLEKRVSKLESQIRKEKQEVRESVQIVPVPPIPVPQEVKKAPAKQTVPEL